MGPGYAETRPAHRVPVLFARRLVAPDVRASLLPELKLRLGAKPSLLLTSAQWVPDDPTLPAVSRIIPFGTVLARGSSDVELDLHRLAAMADLIPPAIEEEKTLQITPRAA